MGDMIFGHYKLNVSAAALAKARKLNSTSKRDVLDGNICIALLRPPKGSNSKEYVAAVAFGSPSDYCNRKLARRIAQGRLESDRPGRNFKFVAKSNKLSEIFAQALDEAINPKLIVKKSTNSGRRNVEVPYAPQWVNIALAEGRKFEFTSKALDGHSEKA